VPQGWEQKLRSPRPASGNEDRANSSFPTAEAVRGAAEPALALAGAGRQLLAQLRGRQAACPSAGWGRRRGPAPIPRHAVSALRPPPESPPAGPRLPSSTTPAAWRPYLRRCTSSRRGWLPGRPLGWTSWCLCRLWCTRMNEEAAAAAAPRGDETPRAQPRRRRPRGGDQPGPGGGGGGGGRGGDGSQGGGRQQSPQTPPAAGRWGPRRLYPSRAAAESPPPPPPLPLPELLPRAAPRPRRARPAEPPADPTPVTPRPSPPPRPAPPPPPRPPSRRAPAGPAPPRASARRAARSTAEAGPAPRHPGSGGREPEGGGDRCHLPPNTHTHSPGPGPEPGKGRAWGAHASLLAALPGPAH
jgi:hypothetical protein